MLSTYKLNRNKCLEIIDNLNARNYSKALICPSGIYPYERGMKALEACVVSEPYSIVSLNDLKGAFNSIKSSSVEIVDKGESVLVGIVEMGASKIRYVK